MKKINGFVFRLSGIVSYSNGSSDSFVSVIRHDSPQIKLLSSANVINNLAYDNQNLNNMLARIIDLQFNSIDDTNKKVTDFTSHISGIVTFNDNTSEVLEAECNRNRITISLNSKIVQEMSPISIRYWLTIPQTIPTPAPENLRFNYILPFILN